MAPAKLATHKFTKTNTRLGSASLGVVERTIYTYSVTPKNVYDVIIHKGGFRYRKGDGTWDKETIEPIHEAIIKHFKLTPQSPEIL